jgi:hypothetical protein
MTFVKEKKKLIIGRNDIIDLPEFGLVNMKAKIDSGALTSAIHCSRIKLMKHDDKQRISFHIPGIHNKGKTFETDDFTKRKIKSSNGHIELRFIIKTNVLIFGKKIRTEFSLTDRSVMKFPILLGRKLLRNRFIIDVALENQSYQQRLEKSASKAEK